MPPHDAGPGSPEGGAPSKRTPRPYQDGAITAARDAIRSGKRAPLLVCPTGGGKTYIFSRIVESAIRKGGTALVLAHREELIEQAAKSIMAEGLTHVGIIAPWARRQHAPVQVASVQTLAAQLKKGRQLPSAKIVVLDEAHHFSSGAPGWYEVANTYRDSIRIGVTATPERGDGSPMGDMFDCLIPVSSVRELQELGVLVPCITLRPDHKTKALCREPVQAYQERGQGERAVVFCATVEHAEMVALTFRDAGYPAATIHADTPWNIRRARLEAFKSQDATPLRRAGSAEDPAIVLTCVYTLTEGWDCPECSVIIVARGCGHAGMMLQMVGRGLRAAPWSGKERCIYWDLRGVTHKHQLPEADREYSLEGKAIKASKSEKDDPPRKCKACGGEFMSWAIDRETGDRFCPLCREPAPEMAPPEVVEREVFEVGSGADPKARRAELDRLAVVCVEKGHKPAWVLHRYHDAFGFDPEWRSVDAAIREARKLLGVKVDPIEVGAERARLEEIAIGKGLSMTWVDRKMAAKFGEQADA